MCVCVSVCVCIVKSGLQQLEITFFVPVEELNPWKHKSIMTRSPGGVIK